MSDDPLEFSSKEESQDESMTAAFIQELDDLVLNLENAIIELENNPNNEDQTHAVFRLFHNLKCSASMMSFKILVDLAHYCEGLLELVRTGSMRLQSDHVDSLLEALTAVKSVAKNLGSTGSEGEERYFSLLHRLNEHTKKTGEAKEEAIEEIDEERIKGEKTSEDDLIKVSRTLIEQMMLLVSEFMLLKNRIQWVQNRYPKDADFLDRCQELEHFSGKLQRSILKLRLSPVAPLFSSMRRVVRTVSKMLNKPVNFDVSGSDTLLDRSILDVLQDPLMHMIRNAIDHGIESIGERKGKSKPEKGNIELSASYRSGEVHISVSDDGGGLDTDKLKKTAVEKNLYSKAQADQMTRLEAYSLIFLPGFSSAEKVTETSGRGVGMDVVKEGIESVGGQIDIQSEIGAGTSFTIRLPLSLAIVDCLGFKVDGQTYAISQVNVEEVVSLDTETVRNNLKEVNGGGRILVVRDEPLPILKLGDIFDFSDAEARAFIQVRHGKYRFVLEVGEIIGPMSIVSQPLPPIFVESAPFSGITKQGDGSLLFQVDVAKLFNHVHAKVSTRKHHHRHQNRGLAGNSAEGALMSSSEIRRLQQKIITFRNNQHFCIPVQRAKRIVFVSREEIHEIGDLGKSYITLDNETIPLVWIEEAVLHQDRIRAETYSLLICNQNRTQFGIPMHQFLGIQRMPEYYETSVAEDGVLGSTVIDNDSYLLLDLPRIINHFTHKDVEIENRKLTSHTKRILVAEDDSFFASELISSLTSSDVEITLAEDGLIAKEMLEDKIELGEAQFDLLVSDIEMPNLTGLGLIRWIRSHDKLKKLPVLAYTAINTDEMRKKVMAAGGDEFISKMNLENLLDTVTRYLNGDNDDAAKRAAVEAEKHKISRIMTFSIGEHWFALPMESIKEVSPISPAAPIPYAKLASMSTLTSFRGIMIPVIDLGEFFGLRNKLDKPPTEQAVIEADNMHFAILVDKIGEVIVESRLNIGDGLPMVTEQDRIVSEYALDVYNYNEAIVTLLDKVKLSSVCKAKNKNEGSLEEKAA